ncbi:MAG: cytochrome c3 family protein [Rhizobiaceae bacterium]
MSGTEAQRVRNLPEAQFTGKGPEACLQCHGGPNMTIMAETSHGDASDPHAPYAQQGCESCHGAGSFHVSSARGGVGFPPLNDFKHLGSPKKGQFDTCLGCHAENSGSRIGIGWIGSIHDASGMTCSTCHEVHSKENPLADVTQQQNLCASCHGLKNSKHEGLENSGMQLDTMKCTTCHNPHQ